jgi:hypothetical protein
MIRLARMSIKITLIKVPASKVFWRLLLNDEHGQRTG